MKATAYTFHHTHWDAEWYFTEQESQVQFVYHMKELFEALDRELIEVYHLDGKSCHLADYFKYCPEDIEKFKKYVLEGKIIIGPLYEQLSCFIAPGESIIKNLQLGMDTADLYGKTSDLVYIPDSFGQTQDYPKIFNGFGIHDFVFRRGMGDQHKLKNDFVYKSNDGSKVLTTVLQAGYSFAGLAFMQGRLIKNAGLNLDKKSIINQMKLLVEESTQSNAFLLPAGKDNCPVMYNFKDLIKQYNDESDDFKFEETTLMEYMDKLRKSDVDFQEYTGEFYATQYHRVHKSIFSARSDIKTVQDKLERLLILEVQPLMCIADSVGIKYERGLLLEIWKMLIRAQTHSEATNSDEVNEQIYARSLNALKYAESIKIYLTRKISASYDTDKKALAVFNTMPYARKITNEFVIYTKDKSFTIFDGDNELSYSVIKQSKIYGGWRRKHRDLLDSGRDYYQTTIVLSIDEFSGLSYKILTVDETNKPNQVNIANENDTYIENDNFRVELFQGKISVRNKQTGKFIENAIYFEDSGDQGDTFDYDYPTLNHTTITEFRDVQVVDSYETNLQSSMTLSGNIEVCKDLISRERKFVNALIPFILKIQINNDSNIIKLKGSVTNTAYNHRLRLVLATGISSDMSIAGTQFGYIERVVNPPELKVWKEEKWLEEPLPIEPLLNHVSLKGDEYTYTVFTRSGKEYEIIGEDFSHIALTLYRSIGHFGLPDLNRRPGRASGIPEEIMEAPVSQMIDRTIEFEFGFEIFDEFEGNIIQKEYIEYALSPIYFQTQEYNRIFVSMKYFEINSLTTPVPQNTSLFELVDCDAVVSTVEKSLDEKSYLLRIYNNENHIINGGKIVGEKIKEIHSVDFREKIIDKADSVIGNISPGKIITLKVTMEE